VRWLDWLSGELYDDELSDALRPCMECWSWLCRFNSARELKCSGRSTGSPLFPTRGFVHAPGRVGSPVPETRTSIAAVGLP